VGCSAGSIGEKGSGKGVYQEECRRKKVNKEEQKEGIKKGRHLSIEPEKDK
jgi:hypothetical protein